MMGKKALMAGNFREEVACGCDGENETVRRGKKDSDDNYGGDG